MATEPGAGSNASNGQVSRKRSNSDPNSIARRPAGTSLFDPASVNTSRAPASVRMYATASAGSFTLTGTGTTPTRIAPSSVMTNSARFNERMPMRSPVLSPARCSPPATALQPASSWRKLTDRGLAGSSSSMIAGRSDPACSANSRPRFPGYPRASGLGIVMGRRSSAVTESRSDNDLPEDLAVLDQPEPLGRFFERQHVVYDRLHAAFPDQAHQRLQVVVVEAVRADDLQLEAPDVAQVFLRVVARGRAANEHLAAALHAAQRRRPGVAAGEVDDHVHAALVGAPLRFAVFLDRPFREVGVLVVDDVVRAQLFQARDLVGAARARDDLGSQHFRQQHAPGADPAARAQHEHLVAALDGLVRDQHAVGRTVGDRQRGGVLERDGVRHADQLVLRDQAFFSEPAVHHLAHQSLLAVQRIHQHPVAALPAVHAAAGLENLARHVQPDDHRHGDLDARHAAHGKNVVIVERSRLDPDHHVVVGHDRVRKILYQLQLIQPAVLFQDNGSHRLLPFRLCITHYASRVDAIDAGANAIRCYTVDVQRHCKHAADIGEPVYAGPRVEGGRPSRVPGAARLDRRFPGPGCAVVSLGKHSPIDADGAPALVAVDGTHLGTVPDKRKNRKAAGGITIEQVAGVVLVARAAPLRRQPVGRGGRFAQRRADLALHALGRESYRGAYAVGKALQLRGDAHDR